MGSGNGNHRFSGCEMLFPVILKCYFLLKDICQGEAVVSSNSIILLPQPMYSFDLDFEMMFNLVDRVGMYLFDKLVISSSHPCAVYCIVLN